MDANEKPHKESFENALFNSLKKHGLLFPVTDDQIDSFEKKFGETENELPARFESAEIFLKKETKVIPIINNDPVMYRKVASTKKPKKK